MCRKVTSLYGSDERGIVSNRQFMPQSIRSSLILASLECLTVSPPRCEFVRLYGRPGRKHRFSFPMRLATETTQPGGGQGEAPESRNRLSPEPSADPTIRGPDKTLSLSPQGMPTSCKSTGQVGEMVGMGSVMGGIWRV